MKAIDIAKDITKGFEGFNSRPYLCPAGIPTIGFGTTYYPDGRKVKLTDKPCSIEEANTYLDFEITRTLNGVIKYCPILIKYDNRLAAIIDFTYNLGIGRLQASTLRRRINQQNWIEAKKELMKWVYGGGKKLNGLIKRRTVEARLID